MRSRLLFNPGPTNVSEDVRMALLNSDMNHREPEFAETMHDVLAGLVRFAGGSTTHFTVPFTASGTGANEAMLGIVRGRLLAVSAGHYGRRLAKIARRLHVDTVEIECEPLAQIDLDKIERAIRAAQSIGEITHMCFVHHETTTSVLAPLAELCGLARRYGIVTMVDAVASLYGHDIDLNRDGVDYCTVTPNKCLEAIPGISFVLGRKDLLRNIPKESHPSFYFDIEAQCRRIHEHDGLSQFTMAIPAFFAMRVALQRLERETVLGRASRYATLKAILSQGIRTLGFEPLLHAGVRTANNLYYCTLPTGVEYAELHDQLKRQGITIYTDPETAAQGRVIFATMGCLEIDDVRLFLTEVGGAVERILS